MQLVIRKLSESHKELEGAILEFRGNFLCRQSLGNLRLPYFHK